MFSSLILIDVMDIGIYIFLISIGVGILYFLINLVLYLKSVLFNTTWISNVSNRQLIQEVIWYCNDILYSKGIKHFPPFKISYYRHSKYLGVFNNKEIIIYIKNATDTISIVSITLHEVNHYIQHKTNTKEYSKYEYYSLKLGYDENPLEKECRQFADKWTQPCLKHLLNKNVVKLQ